jgi:hypothetical protein
MARTRERAPKATMKSADDSPAAEVDVCSVSVAPKDGGQVGTTEALAASAPNQAHDRKARVRRARGKFAHLRTSSADLAREKAQEAEWEDRF